MWSTSAPKTNGMYCTAQTGDIVGDKAIGPTTIIKYHNTHQDPNTSHEREVSILLQSNHLDKICNHLLPVQISRNCLGCVVLAMCLDRTMTMTTTDCLSISWMARNPDFFKSPACNSSFHTEDNSEVNRFLGWAIFSATFKFEKPTLSSKSFDQ